MTRDIHDRLLLFVEHHVDLDMRGDGLRINRIALNRDQIEEHRPPPNPAKVTDSRYVNYQREHGDESWELDALDPSTLDHLIASHVENLVDRGQWDSDQGRERDETRQLEQVAHQWTDVIEHLGLDDTEGGLR